MKKGVLCIYIYKLHVFTHQLVCTYTYGGVGGWSVAFADSCPHIASMCQAHFGYPTALVAEHC